MLFIFQSMQIEKESYNFSGDRIIPFCWLLTQLELIND